MSLVPLHGPVGRETPYIGGTGGGRGGGRCGCGGAGLVVADFLVVAEEVVPLVVALVLAAEAAVVPAVVLRSITSQCMHASKRTKGKLKADT